MKKLVLMILFMTIGLTMVSAQNQAEFKFDQITINVGTFPASSPVKKAVFTFTNVGNAPLVINEVIASCGCTIPKYDRRPIAPGQKGSIEITYNGQGKFTGHFKKSITIKSNARTEMTRIYIEGVMEGGK